MKRISGTLPVSLGDELLNLGGNIDNIVRKGNDIDIIITDRDVQTFLQAVWLGDSWEITELDDNLNLLPQYDIGDVLSWSVIKKLFMTSINSGITDFLKNVGDNVKKKVKKGIEKLDKKQTDFENEVEKKSDNYKRKLDKAFNYKLSDIENELRQEKGFSKINLGKTKEIGDGYFVVLGGNPSTKDFFTGIIYIDDELFEVVNIMDNLSQEDCLGLYDRLIMEYDK